LSTADAQVITALPLFPLQAVLFPGGLLRLKVFEARYLDLMSRCLRESRPFAVVCLRQGSELQSAARETVRFETCGALASILDVDAEQSGILAVRCLGGQRVRLSAPRQQGDGLWLADGVVQDADPTVAPAAALLPSVNALAHTINALQAQGQRPFLTPHHMDDAGWVANRWCEILPISLAAKQKLMELDEPALRLKLVDDFLRSKGLV
jgi:uncharacterized protein